MRWVAAEQRQMLGDIFVLERALERGK